ncbi:MAG: hypothetical protein ACLU6Y_02100 [Ruminococcus sp.]
MAVKIIRFPGNLWNKVISIIKGIIEKIKNITKTISGITDKLGWWKEFLTNERTKAAISLVWKDAKGLLHHVLPTKVEGDVTFGCDDRAGHYRDSSGSAWYDLSHFTRTGFM